MRLRIECLVCKCVHCTVQQGYSKILSYLNTEIILKLRFFRCVSACDGGSLGRSSGSGACGEGANCRAVNHRYANSSQLAIFYHHRLVVANFCVLRRSCPTHFSANEYTFVCQDGKLMPDYFPASQFLRKADNCFSVCIIIYSMGSTVHSHQSTSQPFNHSTGQQITPYH